MPDTLYKELNDNVTIVPPYQPFAICKYLPQDKHQRYLYIDQLRDNLSRQSMLVTDCPGNNTGNAYYLIPINLSDSEATRVQNSQQAIEEIKGSLKEYHSREMRRSLFEKFGRISKQVKPYALRYVYRALTSDESAPRNADEANIDSRTLQVVEMEGPDIVPDMRVHNAGRKAILDEFWKSCNEVLTSSEKLGFAADDRRHDNVQHMASVMSVRDLWQQAKSLCPEGSPVPSPEWLRLQLWPKNKHANVSLHYTGRLNVK